MSLTPEQFDRLLTKEDAQNFVTKEYLDTKFEALFDVLDSIVKGQESFEIEKLSNQAAHDRMQGVLDRHDEQLGVHQKILKKLIPDTV